MRGRLGSGWDSRRGDRIQRDLRVGRDRQCCFNGIGRRGNTRMIHLVTTTFSGWVTNNLQWLGGSVRCEMLDVRLQTREMWQVMSPSYCRVSSSKRF